MRREKILTGSILIHRREGGRGGKTGSFLLLTKEDSFEAHWWTEKGRKRLCARKEEGGESYLIEMPSSSTQQLPPLRLEGRKNHLPQEKNACPLPRKRRG